MNAIRPQISYAELIAARQHANIILLDLKEELQMLLIDDTSEEIEEQKKRVNDGIFTVLDIIDKIDQKFVNQVLLIDQQIDINYPAT